jgi:hypothetical protein
MSSTERYQDTEQRILLLLEEAGLPQPDEVEYGEACVRLLWHEQKLAVVVDIDDVRDRAA